MYGYEYTYNFFHDGGPYHIEICLRLYGWNLRHERVNEELMSFKDGSYKCSNNVTKVLANVVKKKEKDFITKSAERILGYTRGFDHYFAFSYGKVANIINDSSH